MGYSIMNDINTNNEQTATKWHIDMNWFEQNGRSLSVLAQGCLCPKCYQRLKPDSQAVSTDKLMKAVRDCCSKTPDFIHAKMPALESVFRLLLANGNKPLLLQDIMRQLGERCGVAIYRVSDANIYTLLNSDRYYGMNRIDS